MSIENSGVAKFALLVVVSAALIAMADDQADPVVEYYWDKACKTFDTHNPATENIRYNLTAKTYYKHVGRHGVVVKVDSAEVEYYCSGSEIDSQKIINGDDSGFRNLDLTFTNVLHLEYNRYSFPNDTGGVDLALGFEPDSGDTNPDGLIVIDRGRYLPLWLYLYYPDKPGYKRFTRSFRFTEVGGYVFPDSIWEVATRPGIFSDENYRLETGIINIEIIR